MLRGRRGKGQRKISQEVAMGSKLFTQIEVQKGRISMTHNSLVTVSELVHNGGRPVVPIEHNGHYVSQL